MNRWILAAALVTIAAAPAVAAPVKSHHGKSHHVHRAAVAHPDSVTVDGKNYTVCTPNVQDDCIQPREAGLGFGNRTTDVYIPGKADQHP